ncbi:uncharacterized protein FOMMEDRAFT_160569 [Fomitiporia mediterranea MF3/22]|uniref:uncharacterized protein n=1 Tax=Fomitiporia mediterranea (strain MF3/22) TaxID=694068 RepID=UPI00044079B1|nr:uncharacterized protein FOMMEDRAFT_160569 [Fomitiporia mediterranea MF3/22]EJC99502.1 hypothetical protein FOMMEDRAFT_160569 [Fomitiporia mediterranea MF3/22]
MQRRRANTSVEATSSDETSLMHARHSHDSHSGTNVETISRESTIVFDDGAEGSVNVRANASSTGTDSHGILQPHITKEDQSFSTGSMSSNTHTAQAAHVGEKKRKRNAEVLDSQPQASGSSTVSPQNYREDIPNASLSLTPRSKARKKRGHGWTRRKIRRATTQGRAVRVGGKRPVEGVDGEEDEKRPRKRRRISEEAVAGLSNARSMSLDNTIGATNIRQLRSRSIVSPAGPANEGSDEGNTTTRSPSPDRASERPTLEDPLENEVDFTLIKTEDEEEDFLWDTPPPWDWSLLMPEYELATEDTFRIDSNRSTPELTTGRDGSHRDRNESVGSTPVGTPRAQSVDVQSFDRSLVIVLPGTMEEAEPPDELMDVRDEGEDEDEDEGEDDVSVPSIPVDRRRSRAPSPPSLPPSHSVSRLSTPQRDEETESAR